MAERCPDKTEVIGPIPMSPTMEKKILIISIVIIIAALGAAGFFAYVQNSISGTDNAPQVQVQAEGAVTQSDNGAGMLLVCVDKCGDGVCQKSDPECKDNLNCVCLETPQDCPQDCKN